MGNRLFAATGVSSVSSVRRLRDSQRVAASNVTSRIVLAAPRHYGIEILRELKNALAAAPSRPCPSEPLRAKPFAGTAPSTRDAGILPLMKNAGHAASSGRWPSAMTPGTPSVPAATVPSGTKTRPGLRTAPDVVSSARSNAAGNRAAPSARGVTPRAAGMN